MIIAAHISILSAIYFIQQKVKIVLYSAN